MSITQLKQGFASTC